MAHDDIMTWKHFLHYWAFVWGIHWIPLTKGQWCRALISFVYSPSQRGYLEMPYMFVQINLVVGVTPIHTDENRSVKKSEDQKCLQNRQIFYQIIEWYKENRFHKIFLKSTVYFTQDFGRWLESGQQNVVSMELELEWFFLLKWVNEFL